MYGLSISNILKFSVFLASTHGTRIVVDDANSSWTYTGAGWNAVTPATPCTACATQPDPSKVFNHTWHDTALLTSAQLAFSGVSIEVYTICPPAQSDGSYYGTNFTFTLDNVADGTFRGPQPSCTQFMYNYLAYARTNLTLGSHVFEISNSPQQDVGYSTTNLLLDYAVYDDGSVVAPPASNSHSSLSIAAVIVPAIIAGLLLLANITQFIWYRKHKSSQTLSLTSDPPMQSGSPYSPTPQQPLLSGPLVSGVPPMTHPGPQYPVLPSQTPFDTAVLHSGSEISPLAMAPIMSVSRRSENASGVPWDAGHASVMVDSRGSLPAQYASTSQPPAPGTSTSGPIEPDSPPTYKSQW